MSGGRKCFVGSLPDGVSESTLRDEFEQYGEIEDLFVKQGCDPGRQWAMVTFASPSDAQACKEATDRILKLPGCEKAVEVMIARNQGKDDRGGDGPKKIFVGSLPDCITESRLRAEYEKFGPINDVFLKTGCERNKQWAFITFAHSADAEDAKTSTDRRLKFDGSDGAVECMIARNQGLNGKDSRGGGSSSSGGPTKIHVGSLPDDITEDVLRDEFSRYGRITDVFLKTGCESHKQWAFVVFESASQAQRAKDDADRSLKVPGATKACEVMFAKFQGKNGQDPLSDFDRRSDSRSSSSMPAQYAWRMYQTPQGIPYYHNHKTGVTTWECPMEFHYSAMAAHHAHAAHSMYGMYPMHPPHPAMYRPY